ncbi:DUF124-domain-containing protein [Ascobolus immersus RN42]|uniref:Altered inheritance of mitochondria protein 24, mitochondrial n=1 Tax=Ascobolus immersus RN42 TaxID=1160509 RepID=A0A3N4HRP3_ASCIM|nr:DUF124-domain-containing protein [Ascobolus immersus RN42]
MASPPPLPNFQPSQDYPPPPPQQGAMSSPGQQQQQYFPPPPPGGQQSQPGTPYYPPPPGNPPPADQHQQQQHQQFYPPPPIAPPPSGVQVNPNGFGSPPATATAQDLQIRDSTFRKDYGPPPTSPPPHQTQHQAPPPQQQQPAPAATITPGIAPTSGTFNGGSYLINHRDTNSLLTLNLAHGCPFHAKPGAMVAMSPTITLKGQTKFSLKKLVAGGDFSSSLYTGPGEVLLAPPGLGDIVAIEIKQGVTWNLSRDSLLGFTEGVTKEFKGQGLGKAMLSGEGFFVYRIGGRGVLFVTSLGAVIQKDIADGEDYIVDNNHLVAWNCKYQLRQVTSGGMLSSFSASEGVVCRFTGPGTVFIQTRNPVEFGRWVTGAATNGGK